MVVPAVLPPLLDTLALAELTGVFFVLKSIIERPTLVEGVGNVKVWEVVDAKKT